MITLKARFLIYVESLAKVPAELAGEFDGASVAIVLNCSKKTANALIREWLQDEKMRFSARRNQKNAAISRF